jgi:hypothetical protein
MVLRRVRELVTRRNQARRLGPGVRNPLPTVLSAKPASAARLRELQRTPAAADARLRHAARPDAMAAKGQ